MLVMLDLGFFSHLDTLFAATSHKVRYKLLHEEPLMNVWPVKQNAGNIYVDHEKADLIGPMLV